jgi:hypothetical protein
MWSYVTKGEILEAVNQLVEPSEAISDLVLRKLLLSHVAAMRVLIQETDFGD